MNKNKFYHLISCARTKLGMTQTELAGNIIKPDGNSLAPQYLNDIEHGRRESSSDWLIKELARELNLNEDYLHYLNGKYPEKERKKILSQEDFQKAIVRFRQSYCK